MDDRPQPPALALLTKAGEALRAVEVGNTPAVVTAAWRGFCALEVAGVGLAFSSLRTLEHRARWANAAPLVQAAIRGLRSAPALPPGLPGELPWPTGPAWRVDDDSVEVVRAAMVTLSDLVITVLTRAASGGTGEDAAVCHTAAVMAGQVRGCYTGGLRSFPNPYRSSPGGDVTGQRQRQGRFANRRSI